MGYGQGVIARIPMPAGQSLFEIDCRQDKAQVPRLSIALLGPKPEESMKVYVQFPDFFSRLFFGSSGFAEDIRGSETTHYAVPFNHVSFLTSYTGYRDPSQSPDNAKTSLEFFDVRILAIEGKPRN
jgi:hypothetical protein